MFFILFICIFGANLPNIPLEPYIPVPPAHTVELPETITYVNRDVAATVDGKQKAFLLFSK